MNRRRFLKLSIVLTAAVSSLPIISRVPWAWTRVGAFNCFASVRFPAAEFPNLNDVPVYKQIPFKGAWGDWAADSIWLVHTVRGAGVLDATCPHCSAYIRWDQGSAGFLCPICGSRFDIFGEYSGGPTARGMSHYSLSAYDLEGNVLLDGLSGSHYLNKFPAHAAVVSVDVSSRQAGRSRWAKSI